MTDSTTKILEQFIKPGSQRFEHALAHAVGLNLYEPHELSALRAILDPLVEDGTLRRTYRVLTPFDNRNGLEDFDRREDIPAEMVDEWRDPPEPFKVTDDNVVVVYELLREVHEPKATLIPDGSDVSLIREAAHTIEMAAEVGVDEGLFDEDEAEGDHDLVARLSALADRMEFDTQPRRYRHHSEDLQPEVLERIAKYTLEDGDQEFHDLCKRALTDEDERRAVAVTLMAFSLLPLSTETLDELAPGIVRLVEALSAAGFRTVDSGDGSNWTPVPSCRHPTRAVAGPAPRSRTCAPVPGLARVRCRVHGRAGRLCGWAAQHAHGRGRASRRDHPTGRIRTTLDGRPHRGAQRSGHMKFSPKLGCPSGRSWGGFSSNGLIDPCQWADELFGASISGRLATPMRTSPATGS